MTVARAKPRKDGGASRELCAHFLKSFRSGEEAEPGGAGLSAALQEDRGKKMGLRDESMMNSGACCSYSAVPRGARNCI